MNDPQPIPITNSSLMSGINRLNICDNDVVLVHSSLKSFGYVVGGAITVCHALKNFLGPHGTLVMPSFTPQLCHPMIWPEMRLQGSDPILLAKEMPLYDANETPISKKLGIIPECLRSMESTHRSSHPHTSFIANGAHSSDITNHHPLNFRLSGQGPLGRLLSLNAKILMLGTTWSTCTAMHLAEYSSAYLGRRIGQWPVPVKGENKTDWNWVDELLVWEGDFELMGKDFENTKPHSLVTTSIGNAHCMAMSMRELVQFCGHWLTNNRDLRAGNVPPGWSCAHESAQIIEVPDTSISFDC